MPRDRDKDQERKRPARPRAVDQDETTLVEGRNAVTELLRAGRACDKVFLAEG
ncbi:MAG: RNA methyltransferase substrate-binding domain-containing protein, partial [Butyricicoccus sp.]